jgi:hypothetical protein
MNNPHSSRNQTRAKQQLKALKEEQKVQEQTRRENVNKNRKRHMEADGNREKASKRDCRNTKVSPTQMTHHLGRQLRRKTKLEQRSLKAYYDFEDKGALLSEDDLK